MSVSSIHGKPLSLFALQKSSSPFSGANANSCRQAIHFCRGSMPTSTRVDFTANQNHTNSAFCILHFAFCEARSILHFAKSIHHQSKTETEMKTILCCLNSKYIHSSLAPWYLFSACRRYCGEGMEFKVIEGTINENQDNIIERLLSEKADILSFSCYIWNIERVLWCVRKIRQKSPRTIIVLGGPEVSFNAREILRENPDVDFVLSGEGEKALPELIESIRNGDGCDIKGVSYRKGDSIVVAEGMCEPAEEKISPYCEQYFSSLSNRIAYIESSRGCPFNCAFCLSGRMGRVRYFDTDEVKKEMLSLCGMGAKTIKFVDRTFNCSPKRAGEILCFIGENYGNAIPEGVCFHFEIAADIMTEELFGVIETLPVGSVQFEVGIQSFNENTLKAINRKTDLEKVTANVKRLLSFGNCHIHIDLIAGLPEEDYESFIRGFNKAYEIKADMLQLGFLKILKGSPMSDDRENYPCEYSTEPPYEVVSTPYITAEELQKLHTAENELERLYNSGRFRRTLGYVLSVTDFTPYELFYSVGEYLKEKGYGGSVRLDEYVNIIYMYFSSLKNVDESVLRDRMICDRLATNSSDVIPEKLKRPDPTLKKIRRELELTNPVKKGIVRSVAILYSENRVVYCDYDEKNPVTGEFMLRKL